jgi:aldose 1-epimerase
MSLSGAQFAISAGEHAATIVEVGGGIRRYTHAGRDVTVPYAEDRLAPKGCGAVLAPWPNRIRGGRYTFDGTAYQLALTDPAAGNAIHGLARWARWAAVEHAEDSVTLGIDVVPQPGWPFEVRVEVTYTLDPIDGLTVAAVARNEGTDRLPHGLGFHPYVAVDGALDDARVLVTAATHLVTDDASIPVGSEPVTGTRFDLSDGALLGERRFDDAFAGLDRADGRATVEVVSGDGTGARIWLDDAFGYLQIYTLDDLAGRAGVAVEPMSCPADAFNSGDGLVVLDPGDGWVASWGIQPLAPHP